MSEERAMTLQELREELTRQCVMSGGQSEWARRHGLTPSTVSDVATGRRDPSEAVINAMGFYRVVRFIPAKRGSNG